MASDNRTTAYPSGDIPRPNGPSANEYQVGGSHYRKGGEQHWDRIWRLYGPGYFVGCITKYVERYQDKNGIEDLNKAKHFLEKLIELEGMKPKKEYTDEQKQRMYDIARNNGDLEPS